MNQCGLRSAHGLLKYNRNGAYLVAHFPELVRRPIGEFNSRSTFLCKGQLRLIGQEGLGSPCVAHACLPFCLFALGVR